MAALLTINSGNFGKLATYIAEARQRGIEIKPPDLNESQMEFMAQREGDKTYIRFGLMSIKHVGESAIKSIIENREKYGAFLSMVDFLKRVDLRFINRRVVESFILSGAMDFTNQSRRALLFVLEDAIEMVANESKAQMSLFEEISKDALVVPDLPEFPVLERLEMEKEVLGMYVSAHPLDSLRNLFEKKCCQALGSLQEHQNANFMGRVLDKRQTYTKKGEAMGFLRIEDFTGSAQCVLFSEVWSKVYASIKEDQIVQMIANSKIEEGELKLLVKEIWEVTSFDDESTHKSLYLRVQEDRQMHDRLLKLKKILLEHPGEAKVHLLYRPSRKNIVLPQQINYSEEVTSQLENCFGNQSVVWKMERGK